MLQEENLLFCISLWKCFYKFVINETKQRLRKMPLYSLSVCVVKLLTAKSQNKRNKLILKTFYDNSSDMLHFIKGVFLVLFERKTKDLFLNFYINSF